mmetsp:Transcript_38541/g.114419  ORF Transcript_38541/g.114419 Transcript_38541/m.114419 type:complete len:102 (-) Transcript_38541:510-815(-)
MELKATRRELASVVGSNTKLWACPTNLHACTRFCVALRAAAPQVGVCGRTGCGKSTLFMALYRIVEPERGRVLIDGLDTGAIGLRDLRTQLSLVPQVRCNA